MSQAFDAKALEFVSGASLFPTRLSPPGSPYLSQFVPSRDGKRFLFKMPIERPESRPIVVTIGPAR
jgi:hypothetical protein